MNYLSPMATVNWKKVLWDNVSSLMQHTYGKENLSKLIKDAKIGPGTATRIKEQETSVGVDVLEKIGNAFKVAPWQLLHPKLGQDIESTELTAKAISSELANQAATSVQQAPAAIEQIAMSAELKMIAAMFATLPDDPVMRGTVTGQFAAIISAAREPPTKRPLPEESATFKNNRTA